MKNAFTLLILLLGIIAQAQIENQPSNLEECDEDYDGHTLFNLTEIEPEILGNQLPSDFIITFYETQANVLANVNAIANPSSFTSSGQTIWVRLENDVNFCYSIGNFNLIIDTTADIEDVAFSDLTIQSKSSFRNHSDSIHKFFFGN